MSLVFLSRIGLYSPYNVLKKKTVFVFNGFTLLVMYCSLLERKSFVLPYFPFYSLSHYFSYRSKRFRQELCKNICILLTDSFILLLIKYDSYDSV